MKLEQATLFPAVDLQPTTGKRQGKTSERLKRVDTDLETQRTPHLILSTESGGDLGRWRKRPQGWCPRCDKSGGH